MTFNSPEEMDNYLTEQRNTTLSGQSQYAAAGFDKGHDQMRQKFMAAASQERDKRLVTQATNEVTDSLANTLITVTGSDFKGSQQDAAKTILSQYQKLRQGTHMPGRAAEGALKEVITRAALSGHTELVESLVDSELPGIGTIRNLLGEAPTATLLAQATNKRDQSLRQDIDVQLRDFYRDADEGRLSVEKLDTFANVNEKYLTTPQYMSLLHANRAAQARQEEVRQRVTKQGAIDGSVWGAEQAVRAAVSSGQLWTLRGAERPQVLTATGGLKDFDVDRFAAQEVASMTAGMTPDKASAVWASNDLENPDWKAQFSAGLMNFSSLAGATPGKPVGELNSAAMDSIKLFEQVNRQQPRYLKNMLGEKSYEQYENVSILMSGGMPPNTAAAMAANVDRNDILSDHTRGLVKQVQADTAKMLAEPFYKWGWVQRMFGTNTTGNSVQVASRLGRITELMVRSGMYPDLESARKSAGEYLASPAVSVKVNGFVYMRTELPKAPPGEAPEYWFEKFIDDVVKPEALKHPGIKASEVNLVWSPADNAYRAFAAGVPLTGDGWHQLTYRAADIERRTFTEREQRINSAAVAGEKRLSGQAEQDSYGAWRAARELEMAKSYQLRYGQPGFHSRILSLDAYRRAVADGNEAKNLDELERLYPPRRRPTK